MARINADVFSHQDGILRCALNDKKPHTTKGTKYTKSGHKHGLATKDRKEILSECFVIFCG